MTGRRAVPRWDEATASFMRLLAAFVVGGLVVIGTIIVYPQPMIVRVDVPAPTVTVTPPPPTTTPTPTATPKR